MAIMAVYTAQGISPQDYDAARAEISWETDPPAGGLMHLAGFDSDGILSIEVWDSRAAFDAYVRDRFGPTLNRLGHQDLPAPRILKLHNGAQLTGVDTPIRAYDVSEFAGRTRPPPEARPGP